MTTPYDIITRSMKDIGALAASENTTADEAQDGLDMLNDMIAQWSNENGCVQIRTKTSIMEDGKQISGTFHRHVVAPGDDYSGECDKVKAICAATHTAEVIESYKASFSAQGV